MRRSNDSQETFQAEADEVAPWRIPRCIRNLSPACPIARIRVKLPAYKERSNRRVRVGTP